MGFSSFGRRHRLRQLRVAVLASSIVALLAPIAFAAPADAGRAHAHRAAPHLVDRAYVVAQSGGVAQLNLYSDGSIRRLAPTLPTGSGTFGILASPDHHYLYVEPGLGLGTHLGVPAQPQLVTIQIQPDGTLRQVGELSLDPTKTAVSAAISRDGRDLYLGLGNINAGFLNGAVQHFTIGSDGVPVAAGAPVSMGLPIDGAAEPVISPDGKWLYVASYFGGAMVRFAIHTDGSLSPAPVDRVNAGLAAITPIISPDGRFLYTANEQSQTITGFVIHADGSLTQIPGSPFASGSIPHNFVFSKDGKFLYSANTGGASALGLATRDGSISVFRVGTDGALTPLPGSPYKSAPGPIMVNMSSTGKWLYVTSSPQLYGDQAVAFSSYRIRRDGTLDVARTHSFATGQQTADGPEAVVLPASGH